MENTVAWMVQAQVRPGQLDTLQPLMEEMVASTKAEPGTLNYEWFLSEDGSALHIWEKYADSDAALAHGATFVQQFAERFGACLEGMAFTIYGNPSDRLRQVLTDSKPAYFSPWGGFAR